MPELAVTAEEARSLIASKRGFTVDEETGCWLYARTTAAGHGPYLSFYIAVFGEPPPGFEVYHRCQGARRGCVRPNHLDVAPHGTRVRRRRDPPLSAPVATEFSRRIRGEREARRQSRPEFAKELRIAATTLRDWEEGQSQPSAELHRQIVKKLGWDAQPRKWVVTMVHEITVTARSSGEAAEQAHAQLEVEGQPRKTALFNVRPAVAGRGRRSAQRSSRRTAGGSNQPARRDPRRR